MRIIVRFLFKIPFFRIKSNFKVTSLIRPSGIPKISFKKAFTHLNILITLYFYSYTNKRRSQAVNQTDPTAEPVFWVNSMTTEVGSPHWNSHE